MESDYEHQRCGVRCAPRPWWFASKTFVATCPANKVGTPVSETREYRSHVSQQDADARALDAAKAAAQARLVCNFQATKEFTQRCEGGNTVTRSATRQSDVSQDEADFAAFQAAKAAAIAGCAADLTDFDFAVIRYIWSAENGTDLDTRTAIVAPPLGNDVGWNRNITDPITYHLPPCQTAPIPGDLGDYYLAHGGDNCEQGVEAILADCKKLKQDYPAVNPIQIRLRAFWYSAAADGNITVEFATYKGGTMARSGYDFVNTGGTAVQTIQRTKHLSTSSVGANVNGEDVALLEYDPVTNSGSITLL